MIVSDAHTITAKVLPKQMQFLSAKGTTDPDGKVAESGYSGAFGGGKTRAVCIKAVMRASHPGAREGLTRKTFSALRSSTLRTLLEADGSNPPVLPPGTYTHHMGEHRIKLNGGGEIYYFGCDNTEAVKSLNLSGCGIDEATELDEAEYITLIGRVRLVTKAGLELYWATNPGGKSHFLYKRFHMGKRVRPAHITLIETNSAENFFLPGAYLATLDDFTGAFKSRFVEGKWGNFEGMVYELWNRAIHISDKPSAGYAYAAVDDGFTNPFAVVVAHLTGEEDLHVFGEAYRSKLMQDEKVDICKRMAEQHDILTFYADPSAAGLIQALRNAGLDCQKADNDVLKGIGKVQRRLAVNKTLGRARLTVSPACEHLLDEIEGYAWESGKDKPVKTNDHLMDALRYLVASIDRAGLAEYEAPDESVAQRAADTARVHAGAVVMARVPDDAVQGEEWMSADNEALWD